MDIESYFASLSEDIKIIDIANKGITHIPESILKFKKLEVLHCRGNLLSSLPQLPESLKKLYCPSNQLTSLPVLNEKLEYLECSENQLYYLPNPNTNLRAMYFNDNPIYEIIKYDDELSTTKQKIKILNNFRESYYCLKFKKRFRDWLWVKVREPRIREKYHPRYLLENLVDEETDFDTVLAAW